MTKLGANVPHSGIRAVFFDAVGTLLFPDPPATTVYAAVGREFGLDADPAEIGQRFRDAFRTEELADRASGWLTGEACAARATPKPRSADSMTISLSPPPGLSIPRPVSFWLRSASAGLCWGWRRISTPDSVKSCAAILPSRRSGNESSSARKSALGSRPRPFFMR